MRTSAPLIPEVTYPPKEPSFRFIAACDMPVNPIAWLIRDYIEQDALAVMYGQPGKCKSFIALDLSCCIASNIPFHGHEVKPGAVFYIAGEGHNGLARRIRAWADHNSIAVPEMLFMSEAPTDLSNTINAALVAQAVQQLADETGITPTMIVIDTLARNFGGEENSAADMGQFVRNVDTLRRRWKATVLIVHHSGKDGDRGARGSSALKGAVDAEYEVTRCDEDKLIRLTPRKMKDAEEPCPLAFELMPVALVDDTGMPIRGAALKVAEYTVPIPDTTKLGKHQKAALNLLEQMHDEFAAQLAAQGRSDHPVNILVEAWKARCIAADIPRQRFHDAKSALIERDQVFIEEPHVFLVRPSGPY